MFLQPTDIAPSMKLNDISRLLVSQSMLGNLMQPLLFSFNPYNSFKRFWGSKARIHKAGNQAKNNAGFTRIAFIWNKSSEKECIGQEEVGTEINLRCFLIQHVTNI
jgi:hypothetical protein